MQYKKELEKYIKRNGEKYDKLVLGYAIAFVDRIKTNDILKNYFKTNHITIYPFLSELLPMSQHKLKSIGKEILDENEINQVFGTVILNNEILKLLLKDEIIITGINRYGEFVYELSDDSISYFNSKYGIKLNKKFSLRDIVILNIDNVDTKY